MASDSGAESRSCYGHWDAVELSPSAPVILRVSVHMKLRESRFPSSPSLIVNQHSILIYRKLFYVSVVGQVTHT